MNLLILQLHGKKQHIRALLIDRVLLQHEVGANAIITWHSDLAHNRYCRAVTISHFHYTIFMAKRIHKDNVVVISIERLKK